MQCMPLTCCAAFSQAAVKAVTVLSVLLRWLCRPTAAFGGGGLQHLDRQMDRQTAVALAGHVSILVHRAECAGICPCQVTPAYSLLRWTSVKC